MHLLQKIKFILGCLFGFLFGFGLLYVAASSLIIENKLINEGALIDAEIVGQLEITHTLNSGSKYMTYEPLISFDCKGKKVNRINGRISRDTPFNKGDKISIYCLMIGKEMKFITKDGAISHIGTILSGLFGSIFLLITIYEIRKKYLSFNH